MKDDEVIANFLGVLVGIIIFSAIVFGVWCGLTWLVVLIASGFGYSLPFWPTFGCVALVNLLFGGGGIVARRNSRNQ